MNNAFYLQEIKKIVWEDKLTFPNDILIRFWQKQGAGFTRTQLDILRDFPAESVLRRSRDISKPNPQRKLL